MRNNMFIYWLDANDEFHEDEVIYVNENKDMFLCINNDIILHDNMEASYRNGDKVFNRTFFMDKKEALNKSIQALKDDISIKEHMIKKYERMLKEN